MLLQAPIRLFGFKIFNLRILAEYPEDLSNITQNGAEEDAAPEEEAESAHEVTYELEGVWDEYNSSTGLVDRNTFSMADLMGLDFEIGKPVFSDYLMETHAPKTIGDMKYSEPMPFSLDLEVEDTVLPAGQYRLRYTIKDMLDRTYYTDFFDLTWDGQNAVFTDPNPEPAE